MRLSNSSYFHYNSNIPKLEALGVSYQKKKDYTTTIPERKSFNSIPKSLM